MYSLVLMMAVTGAPQTQNCGHGGGCAPCYANYYSCGGCWGAGSGWGANYEGWFPGYTSYACSGCAGNVTFYHSCAGYRHDYWMPFSCFGYGIYGGTTYNWPTPIPLPVTSYGYGYPKPVESSMPRVEKKDDTKKPEDKKPEELGKPKPMSFNVQPDRAKVVVRLPVDAKLYANGQLTELTTAERTFSTPALIGNRDFQYTMKVEYTRNGNLVSDSKTVKVWAGGVSVVEFADKSDPGTAARSVSLR
jgi:uncharacterized protein (TIGR03000 family)